MKSIYGHNYIADQEMERISVTENEIAKYGCIEDDEGGSIDLRAMLNAINRRIRFLLNRDLMIGHAYFHKVDNFEGLKDVLLEYLAMKLRFHLLRTSR